MNVVYLNIAWAVQQLTNKSEICIFCAAVQTGIKADGVKCKYTVKANEEQSGRTGCEPRSLIRFLNPACSTDELYCLKNLYVCVLVSFSVIDRLLLNLLCCICCSLLSAAPHYDLLLPTCLWHNLKLPGRFHDPSVTTQWWPLKYTVT